MQSPPSRVPDLFRPQRRPVLQDYPRVLRKLLQRFGLAQIGEMAKLLEAFGLTDEGEWRPDPQLTLGLEPREDDRSAAILDPSGVTGKKGPPQVVGVFYEPRNFLRILRYTREASLLLMSVPTRIEGYAQRLVDLKRVLHGSRQSAYVEILRTISSLVFPPGQENPYTRRYLILWVPAATASRGVEREETALLDANPASIEGWAGLVAASLEGTPCPDLRGTPLELMWRASPFSIWVGDNRIDVDSQPLYFWEIEPEISVTALRELRELDLDILTSLRSVLDSVQCRMLVRSRGRPDFFERRLRQLTKICKPIKDSRAVSRAHWLFIPGSSQRESGFDWFPLEGGELQLLLNRLSSTITRPVESGDVVLAPNLGGAPYFINSAVAKHFLFLGEGGAGKSAMANWVGLQLSPFLCWVNFNASQGEAFPALCSRLSSHTAIHPIENYRKDSGQLQEGVHLVSTPEIREFVVYFGSPELPPKAGGLETEKKRQGEALRIAKREIVQPAAEAFINSLQLPHDLPIFVRPYEGCDMALYAAFIELLMIGLKARWVNEIGDRMDSCWVFDDVQRLPWASDPEDEERRCGDRVRNAIVGLIIAAHKDRIRVVVGGHSRAAIEERFGSGTTELFHTVISVSTVKEPSGRVVRVYRLVDPNDPERIVAELDGDLRDQKMPELFFRQPAVLQP